MADKVVIDRLSPPNSTAQAHIVRVGRDKSFTSDTLAREHLAPMEAAFRAARWWRDRWTNRVFRAEARRVMREQGGVVLIGPGVSFEVPPPFGEFFEAIEFAGGSLRDDERLKTISGPQPTRTERVNRALAIIFGLSGVLMVVGLVVGYFQGLPMPPIIMVFGGMVLGVGLIVALASVLVGRRSRFFLVPGGVAVVRRSIRPGGPPRITVFSRSDSCLVFRHVSTGKTVILVMELWTHLGKVVRRAVTERAAMSVLAVWRSSQPPLEDDRLEALLRY